MKRHFGWSYEHYVPIFGDENEIYICRLAPDEDSFTFDVKLRPDEEYTVYLRERGEGEFSPVGKSSSTSYTVCGLLREREYEFYVKSPLRESRVRLVRCGESFGTVVNYLHPEDGYYPRGGRFFSSPSILKHPDGYMLASMDLFGGEATQSFVFRSDDGGKSWHHTCDLQPAYCAKLFIHRARTYIIALSRSYGDLMIGETKDGGFSFTDPVLLMRGAGSATHYPIAGIHKQAQPVVEFGGRIWAAMEWGSWKMPYNLATFVASAPADCDLLDPHNWSFSEPLKYDGNWKGASKPLNKLKGSFGTLENCLIPVGDKLYSIARYEIEHCTPSRGRAVVYRVNADAPEEKMSFVKVINHPGNHAKFVIKYDGKRKKYLSLVNPLYTLTNHDTRNLVTLISSENCMEWLTERDVYDYRDCSADKVGIQYIDFEIDGDDIILLARVGINGADSYHNSNCIIFDRIPIEA